MIKKEDFYHKRKLLKGAVDKEEFVCFALVLQGRLLSKRKSWIRKGQVLFEKTLIDAEEPRSRVRERKRS